MKKAKLRQSEAYRRSSNGECVGWVCDGCGREWRNKPKQGAAISFAPMLKDPVWAKLAHKRDVLCSECVLERAVEKEIKLRFADLRPCAFNVFEPSSLSWFVLFASAAPSGLILSDDWRGAMSDAVQWAAGQHSTSENKSRP
jgi:hypothetical protein